MCIDIKKIVSAFMPMPGASGGGSSGTPYPPYPVTSPGYQPPAQGYSPYPISWDAPSSMYPPPVPSSIGCYPPPYPPTSSASASVSLIKWHYVFLFFNNIRIRNFCKL